MEMYLNRAEEQMIACNNRSVTENMKNRPFHTFLCHFICIRKCKYAKTYMYKACIALMDYRFMVNCVAAIYTGFTADTREFRERGSEHWSFRPVSANDRFLSYFFSEYVMIATHSRICAKVLFI